MPFKKGQPANATTFKKGQSGNPNGRPKIAHEISALAAQHCPDAIARLAHIMKHGSSDSAQVMAADKILDRGCGRTPQSFTDGDGKDGILIRIRHLLGDED